MHVGAVPTLAELREEAFADGLTASGRSLSGEAADFAATVARHREKIRAEVAALHAYCQGFVITEQPSAVDQIHMPLINETLDDITKTAARKVEEDTGFHPADTTTSARAA